MFKNAVYVLSLLLAATAVAACENEACNYINSHYTQCLSNSPSKTAFKKCLCTKRFLVNYDRCQTGFICDWDGVEPLTEPCPKIYCPGEFIGGFDAKKFCALGPVTPTVIDPTATAA
ncbi:hypothetical protein CPB86DRAFT_50691 [Serendipita vermifera]|nr:hypothetical protein CPB86DRAFT_50691 [Serendipita vermifera]